jgi:hypothetical protein
MMMMRMMMMGIRAMPRVIYRLRLVSKRKEEEEEEYSDAELCKKSFFRNQLIYMLKRRKSH